MSEIVAGEAELSLELLNSAFQRYVSTVSCIPHQCKLAFSRTLKFCLDAVLSSPDNISAWIRLLLLPIGTLQVYRPKCSAEEKSGMRRKLQVRAINQALLD